MAVTASKSKRVRAAMVHNGWRHTRVAEQQKTGPRCGMGMTGTGAKSLAMRKQCLCGSRPEKTTFGVQSLDHSFGWTALGPIFRI